MFITRTYSVTFNNSHGLGCLMSTIYWFTTCFSSVSGSVAKRLNSHFPFVSPTSSPQRIKRKKKKSKQERNLQHYTLILTPWTFKLFSNRSGKNPYNDSVICLLNFTYLWIKNQNIIIVSKMYWILLSNSSKIWSDYKNAKS